MDELFPCLECKKLKVDHINEICDNCLENIILEEAEILGLESHANKLRWDQLEKKFRKQFNEEETFTHKYIFEWFKQHTKIKIK